MSPITTEQNNKTRTARPKCTIKKPSKNTRSKNTQEISNFRPEKCVSRSNFADFLKTDKSVCVVDKKMSSSACFVF